MPRLQNVATGCVVNVDDETAARLEAREFDMGEWVPFDPADMLEVEPVEPAKPRRTRRKQ